MEKYKEDEGYIKEEAKVCYTLKGVPVIIFNFFQFWSKFGFRLIRLRWI